MALDLTALEWATNTLVQTNMSYTDANGITTEIDVANKSEPTQPYRDSGALFEQPIPRAYLNYMFNQYYIAFQDIETRLAALETP